MPLQSSKNRQLDGVRQENEEVEVVNQGIDENQVPEADVPPVTIESKQALQRKAQAKKEQQKKAIVEMDFVGTTYPGITVSAVTRDHLKVEHFEPRNEQTSAEFVAEEVEKCVICHSVENEQNEELIDCQGLMNGASRRMNCKSRFHQTCMINYNHGGFMFQYSARPECQNKLLCPLHSCVECSIVHKKQAAYVGAIVECLVCLRGFHTECVPVGAKMITVDIPSFERGFKLDMMVCPSHASLKSTGSNISVCYDCDEKDGVLIKCSTCLRSFHEACRETKQLDGQALDSTRCCFCLCADTVKVDTPVIARWRGNTFYLAITRDWKEYPKSQRSSATKFKTLGYTVVEWKKEGSKSILPISDICKLTTTNVKAAAKEVAEEWQEALNEQANNLPPVVYKEVLRTGQTSRYLNGKPPKTDERVEEVGICSCTGPNRCTTDDCIYFAMNNECPPECGRDGRICKNRNVSDKNLHPHIERRETLDKGFGVFATKPIQRGEFLSEYVGEIIDKAEKARRWDVIIKSSDFEVNIFMMDLKNGLTVDAARYGNISRYINHSCDPNCEVDITHIFVREEKNHKWYEERAYIKAARPIAEGDEITFNYDFDTNMKTVCYCEAENCTGVIGAADRRQRARKRQKAPKNAVQPTTSSASKRRIERTEEEQPVQKKSRTERTAPIAPNLLHSNRARPTAATPIEPRTVFAAPPPAPAPEVATVSPMAPRPQRRSQIRALEVRSRPVITGNIEYFDVFPYHSFPVC
ncbi:unnamed protein product [Caenorhabditis sp. 36 PRJEB53466]|nr:unnamed protein product [Caenorhabditis sp. 36 PRJEB53466]